jgi:L-gulonolactone oxidase
VFTEAVKNLDPSHLSRFKAVRDKFDPKGMFKSVVGEIIGVV